MISLLDLADGLATPTPVLYPYHIGLDVHAKTVAIAWAGSDGSLESHGSCASSNLSVDRTLYKLAALLG